MLLKLISTTLPITLNPSMQFLVYILLSWRARRIKIQSQEARHVYPKIVDIMLAATCIEELFSTPLPCWGWHASALYWRPLGASIQATHPTLRQGGMQLKLINQAAYEWLFKCFLGVTPNVWCCWHVAEPNRALEKVLHGLWFYWAWCASWRPLNSTRQKWIQYPIVAHNLSSRLHGTTWNKVCWRQLWSSSSWRVSV